jgi:glycerol-3-phosphate acyltransferase PlsY
MTVPILLVLLSYILGATPSALWIGQRVHGVDLRKEGSGNLGATNAFRVLGRRAALPVVIADVLKGWIPVALFPGLIPERGFGWTLAFAAAVIVGHVFSFWVGFRGGKGVATSGGVFLALAPTGAFAVLLLWIGSVYLTGYVSVSSILAALALPVAVYLTPHRGGDALVLFSSCLAAFVVWAHRKNIGRLLRSEEPRFGARRR